MSQEEENIYRKKLKKLDKHYSVMLNGQKIKILNFRFKNHKTKIESYDVVELITKIKYENLPETDVILVLEKGNEIIRIIGDKKYSYGGLSSYCIAYSIKELN